MLLKPTDNESVGKKIRPVTAGHIPGNINEPKKGKKKNHKGQN